MARTLIKKYQLDFGVNDNILGIVNVDIAANAAIVTSKLADGANFIQRNGSVVFTADQSMGGFRLTNVGAPVQGTDAVRLVDLQNNQAGLSGKESVRAATTGNITLSGTQTIDGVAVIAGDRVLVKNQTAPAENGIYEVSAGAWVRTEDADSASELYTAFVFVGEGTTNADSGWLQTADSITLGLTAITWVQFSGGGQIIAGAGLTKTGNTLDVGTASSARIVVNADNIDLATVLSPGSEGSSSSVPVITWDAYGRITAVSTQAITPSSIGAQPLDADLTAIAALGGTGFSVRTASNTWALRTIAGTAGNIIVTNGDGVAGNPTINLSTVTVTGSGPALDTVDVYGRVASRRALLNSDLPTDTLLVGNKITRETPAGAVNGVNTSFTLAYTPISGTEEVFLNGQLVDAGIGNDYTISGATITFGLAPISGDKIRVNYFK